MKVFISQPMNGLTDEQIIDTRYGAFEWIKQMYPDAEIVNGPIDCEKYDELNPVVMLGTGIVLLGKADLAYFVKGWKDARGCVIEHMVAKLYGIETIEEEPDPSELVTYWDVYEVANTEEEQPIAWQCRNCGEVVDVQYKHCPECGLRVAGGTF